MLSPGKYYLQVPKDTKSNLEWRLRLWRLCKGSRWRQRAVIEMCRRDILFYISSFVWQYNPKHVGGEVGPFITWPFQEEAIRKTLDWMYREQDDVVWEKSRELGATWLALIMDDWACLFHGWKKFLAISHSEQAVDRSSDPDSLFWKVKFMHKHLPGWLLRGAKKRKLGFEYPATSSSFNGAANTERAGVGGRATKVLLDEFSKHPQAQDILGQTRDTGPRLFIGTHYGVGTTFFHLTQRPDMCKVVMHWSQHPEKNKGLYRYNPDSGKVDVFDKTYPFPPDYKFVMDGRPTGGPYPGVRSPWYDRECQRRGSSRDVAMHLDIDPKGAVEQFFDALTIYRLKQSCRPPLWEGDLHYDTDLGIPNGLHRREGGPIKLWLNPDGHKIPAAKYVFGADVSTGSGATPSCLAGGNATTGEKVFEYRNARIDAKTFAPLAVALCRLFADVNGNAAWIAWEIPGPGQTFGATVVSLDFLNIYFREGAGIFKPADSDIPGWVATAPNIRSLLEEYRAGLNDAKVMNFSESALDECLNFKYNAQGNVTHSAIDSPNDPSGAKINHGDMAIADALMYMMMRKHGTSPKMLAEQEGTVLVGSLSWRRLLADQTQADPLAGWR